MKVCNAATDFAIPNYKTNTLALGPTNLIRSNILAGTNFYFEYGPQGQVTQSLGRITSFLNKTNTLTNYNRGGTFVAPTNTIMEGIENFAGRSIPTWFDDKALQFSVQPGFYDNHVYILSTASGASATALGVNVSLSGGTTLSHTTPDPLMPYMLDLATGTTSNLCASLFTVSDIASAGMQSGPSPNAGYFFATEWCDTNNINGIVGGGAGRHFIGLTSLSAANLTNIVVTTNATGQYVGLMADPHESLNMFITARDSVAEFRTNTGINFVATNMYKIFLMNAPTSRFLNWKIKDLTARTEAFGWFTNNVPTNYMKWGVATKNGTNRAASIRISRLYCETPLFPQ